MSCPVCFGGDDAVVRESLNAGIGVLLGVTVVVLGLLRAVLRAAGPPLTRVRAPGDRVKWDRPEPVPRASRARCSSWLGLPVAASAHAGQVDQHPGARPLADAGAVRRLGRLLRLRAVPLPPRPRRRGPTITACAARWSSWVEGGVLVAEIVAARVLLDAVLEQRAWTTCRTSRRPPSCASSPSSSRGTSTIPGADGTFGRTDITLVDPDNPLGLDDADDAGAGRHHHGPAEPAGRASPCW